MGDFKDSALFLVNALLNFAPIDLLDFEVIVESANDDVYERSDELLELVRLSVLFVIVVTESDGELCTSLSFIVGSFLESQAFLHGYSNFVM